MVTYRPAILADIRTIKEFVDFWLSGRGMIQHAPGASNDYFVTESQHLAKIKYGTVLLAFEDRRLVGWAAKGKNDALFYLLIAATHRHRGIGSALLKLIDPQCVRSKNDQSTGDPINFYLKHNYRIIARSQGKKHNIDVLVKKS